MARKNNSNENSSMELRPSDVYQAIKLSGKQQLSTFIWGPPGIGKSQVIAQMADEMGYRLVDIRLSQMEPTDLRGIPFPSVEASQEEIMAAANQAVPQVQEFIKNNAKVTDNAEASVINSILSSVLNNTVRRVVRWSPPHFLDKSKPTIYFFDEMNAAPQSIQAAAYQIVLDRKIGDFDLREDDIVIAAGNRETDKGSVFKMPTPLMNRFMHINMKANFDDWQDWAINSTINPAVVGYLTSNKQELFEFNPASASKGFATPRSWSFVSKVTDDMDSVNENVFVASVAGCIGEGLATKYNTYLKLSRKLPNPTDILNGKVTKLSEDQKEVSIMYSLTVSLCYELRAFHDEFFMKDKKKHGEKWAEMTDYFFSFALDNFQPELCILGAKSIFGQYRLTLEHSKMKKFTEFVDRYGDYIIDN